MDAAWTPTLTWNVNGAPIGTHFAVADPISLGSFFDVFALYSGAGVPGPGLYVGVMTFTFVCS